MGFQKIGRIGKAEAQVNLVTKQVKIIIYDSINLGSIVFEMLLEKRDAWHLTDLLNIALPMVLETEKK